jgi:hypothetical protein
MANPRNLANIAPNVNGSDGKVTIGTATTNGLLTLKNTNPATSLLSIQSYANTTEIGNIKYDQGTDLFSINTVNVAAGITFNTGASSTERVRITASGYLKASNTGTYSNSTGSFHELRTDSGAQALFVQNSSTASYNDAVLQVQFTAQTPNKTGAWFLYCGDTTNQKASILTTGTFESRTSTYGGVSDIKLKQDIVDAASQWDDLKAVRVRKFRFKDEPESALQIGVIAQELETVSAGLVYENPDKEEVQITNEDGSIETKNVETGTTTKSVKYSILYMKAVKALQEAMTRIEQLEARLDAANL